MVYMVKIDNLLNSLQQQKSNWCTKSFNQTHDNGNSILSHEIHVYIKSLYTDYDFSGVYVIIQNFVTDYLIHVEHSSTEAVSHHQRQFPTIEENNKNYKFI